MSSWNDDLETRTLEPSGRTSHICHRENRLESRYQPLPRYQLELAVSLSIQSVQAVMADRQIGRSECDRNLTHQSTDIEQQLQTTGMTPNVDGGDPFLRRAIEP